MRSDHLRAAGQARLEGEARPDDVARAHELGVALSASCAAARAVRAGQLGLPFRVAHRLAGLAGRSGSDGRPTDLDTAFATA